MKHCLILLFTLVFINSIAQTEFGQINDPDGYTNVRESESSSSTIIYTIKDGDFFLYTPDSINNWFEVQNFKGEVGFMHKSRIIKADSLIIKGNKSASSDINIRFKTKHFQQFYIVLTEVINENYFNGYYTGKALHRYVDIFQNKEKVTALNYEEIEGLGGSNEINILTDLEPNYLILLKHGDYSGQTIVLAKDGKITKMKGGAINLFNDTYLFSFGECDVGFCSLSVFNTKSGELEYELKDINDWYEFYTLNDSLIVNIIGPGQNENTLNPKLLEVGSWEMKAIEKIEKAKLLPVPFKTK